MENFNSLQIQSNLIIRLTTGTREEPHLFRQHKEGLAVQQWLVTDWTTGKTQQGCFLKGKMDKCEFIWVRQADSKRNSNTIICLQKTMRKAHFFIHMVPLKINKLTKWQRHMSCSIIPPQNTSRETFCKGRSPPGSAAEDAAPCCREKALPRNNHTTNPTVKSFGSQSPPSSSFTVNKG